MRKLNFYNKKGFTLVECIVAIAVFAVMTSMVMIIISAAIDTTRQAVNGERDLNQMVEAVENDQAVREYDASDSSVLVMKFGDSTDTDPDDNFSITYSTTDGYMNYMSCPRCDYVGSRYEFLRHIADSYTYKNSSDALKSTYAYTYWFDPLCYETDKDNEAGTYKVEGVTFDSKDNTDDTRTENVNTQKKKYATYLRKFVCPNCEQIVEAKPGDANEVRPLYCLICDNKESPYGDDVQGADAASSKGFHWNNKTGSFYCNKCGSSYVIEYGMKDRLGAGAQFNVGGIFPNAIRYGSIDSPKNDDVKNFVKAETSDGDISGYNVTLTTTAYSSTMPHKYQISVTGLTAAVTGNKDVTLTIELPPGYMIPKKLDAGTGKNWVLNLGMVNGTTATISWNYKNGLDSSKGSEITLTGVKTGTNPQFAFSLVNEKSGISFDSDYADEGGLANFWFKIKDTNGDTNTFGVPRTFKTSS